MDQFTIEDRCSRENIQKCLINRLIIAQRKANLAAAFLLVLCTECRLGMVIKVKKILIVITTAFHPYGGLSTVMLNYYRAMQKKVLKIDFASTNDPEKELLNELDSNGSNYYNLGSRKTNLIMYVKKLRALIENGKYDVIHVNGNSSTMILELYLAEKARIPMRISHLHNIKTNYPLLNVALKPLFKKSYTHAVAVSEIAGNWLYGKNYFVLNNAINTEHYKYDAKSREHFRRLHGLGNKFVIGNVGKLNNQKNHIFLLRLFAIFYKKNSNSALVIVGGGELEDQLKTETKKLRIEDSVLFLGMCNDVKEALQGFDLFVFPSIFEGLGLAVIEAQASGLHCIASDVIPKETGVTDNIKYLSLTAPMQMWIEEMESVFASIYDRNVESSKACESIKERGYDITSETRKLTKLYNLNSI